MKWARASRIAFIGIITGISIILSVLGYQYSASISEQALRLASEDVRSNAEIEVHNTKQILVSKIEGVTDNLQVIASAQSVKAQELDRARPLFQAGQESTSEITNSYFWVDKDGKLLWADAFSNNNTLYESYRGADRTERSYYLEPRETAQPHFSSVIESADGVPRLYISYPILVPSASPAGGTEFAGVVVAASDLDQFGAFLSDQVSTRFDHSLGMTDREGTILFSQTPELLGKNVFGPETQAILPEGVKESFNQVLTDALAGRTGSGDLTYQGETSTIAYEPVAIKGKDFGVLYVIAPHQLASTTISLIDQQRTVSLITIGVISAVSAGVAFVILTWNRQLSRTVAERTGELAKSNESLREAIEQLKVHDKMQHEFINIAAHELRTPIQPLLGMTEMMESAVKEGKGGRVELSQEEVDMMARNSRRLEKLTKNILDITRIESRRLNLDREIFDMNEKVRHVIRDSAEVDKVHTDSDGTTIATTRVSPRNPGQKEIIFAPPHRQMLVHADKTRIFEVVSNLLNNALKFTKDGRIEISLSETDDHQVLLKIMDSGAGIDPEIMPRLFSKFVTKGEAGTGLGLYIAKNIVQEHGGRMWAENNASGRGASFYFTLPQLQTEGSESPSRGPETSGEMTRRP
jgi:signal transduction histidine kinase